MSKIEKKIRLRRRVWFVSVLYAFESDFDEVVCL